MSYDIDLIKKHYPSTNAKLETMKKISYASTIKSIMYVIIYTHLGVLYVLSVINRHQVNLGITH
jgi:hypothetical protein